MLKTHKFARKPFYVDAVRVSEANMEEVAKWCEGTIETSTEKETEGQKFISVKVYRPLNERQSQAFIGDWVLFAGSGFKVYTPKAFDKSFEKVRTLTKAQADEAGIKVPHEPRQKPAGRKPVPTAPKKRTQRELTTNVGKAIREAQEAKEAEKVEPVNDPTTYEDDGKDLLQEPTVTPPVDVSVPPKTPQEAEADKLIAEVLKHPQNKA